MPDVTIYTDGACLGNPGPGGYGVVLISGRRRSERSAGYRRTTNNRMEILAAITGLEALKAPCTVTLYSDSRYLVDAMTLGWARRWQANGWWRTRTERAANSDLWERLLTCTTGHEVTFLWVRGHAGNRWNERCDQLANEAARWDALLVDEGYEGMQGAEQQGLLTETPTT